MSGTWPIVGVLGVAPWLTFVKALEVNDDNQRDYGAKKGVPVLVFCKLKWDEVWVEGG